MSVAVVCSYVGCTALVHSGTRCEAHAQQPKRVDRRGPEHWKRFNRSSWGRLRQLILHRDPLCQRCQRAPSKHVHHIVDVANGGKDEESNLQGLCASCHSEVTHGDRGSAFGGIDGRTPIASRRVFCDAK